MHGINFSQKSDIFSLGCVLYEMCMLRRPYYENEEKTPKPPVTGDYSPELKRLIMDCMAINPSSRIDTKTLCTRFRQLQRVHEGK